MPKPSRARTAATVARSKQTSIERGRYGGLDAAERRRQRRDRLLAAGRDLFGAGGFAATTIEQLCARANVASRTFYEEFGSRDALLAALYLECVAKLSGAVYEAIARAGTDAEAVVRAGVRAYVLGATSDAKSARIMLLESIGVSPELETLRRRVLRDFAARTATVAASFAAAGVIPDADFEGLSFALVGAANEVAIESVLSKGKFPAERAIAVLTRLWIASLSPPATPAPLVPANAAGGASHTETTNTPTATTTAKKGTVRKAAAPRRRT